MRNGMKAFCKSMSLLTATAVLMCGCSSGGDYGRSEGGDIDLAGDMSEENAPETTTTTTTITAAVTTTTTARTAFTGPDGITYVNPEDFLYTGVYGIDENGIQSLDPVEYNLYYMNWETGENTLLYEHILSTAFYENIRYATVNGGQTPFMIAYDVTDGVDSIVTAYTAQYGELEILGFIDSVKTDEGEWADISEILGHTMMVIRDGDHILHSFCNDKAPQFEELFVLENGIYDYDQVQSLYREKYHLVYTASYAKNEFFSLRDGYIREYTDETMMEYFGHTLDEFYICPDCGYGYEYFLWADKDGSWFWYHPETGESEPIELIGDHNYDVFIAKAE